MIRSKEVRLVGDKGEQLGIMPSIQALTFARKQNLDLVEVASNAEPPVCRMMDYGKYKYEQTKKEREARKNQKVSTLKEVRMRPKIGDHDFEAKFRTVRKQLEAGDKVKVTIMFRGRENTHPELGLRLLKRMSERVSDISDIEGQPSRMGSRLHMILIHKVKQPQKAEVKEGSTNAKAEDA